METRFALNKYNKKTFIDDAQKSEDYYCPACRNKMVVKNQGKIRIHHFAHQSGVECTDNWHSEMSEWHLSWQSLFPKDSLEFYKEKDGQIHKADVLLEDKKAVFEFQHSQLSPEEFNDRNRFYNSLGYLVIWVFDFVEMFENGQIEMIKNAYYKWARARKTFMNFNPANQRNVEIYFQTKHGSFGSGDINLIRVIWALNGGFTYFATDGFDYSDKDIVERFSISNTRREKTVRLADLFDPLIKLYEDGRNTYYLGCPESLSHICVKTDKGGLDRKMMSCEDCGYSVDFGNNYYVCKKRFIDIGLSGNTQIEVVEGTRFRHISKIRYESNDGASHQVDLPVFENPGESITNLWQKEWNSAVFVNVITGKAVKFDKGSVEQFRALGYAKGFVFADKAFTFKGQWQKVCDFDKPDWFCIWFKEA